MELSERHRLWGFNCPAVDIDFLMVEYNHAEPVALIEYKFEFERIPDLSHPSYRAIGKLADCSDIPFAVVSVFRDPWRFVVYPVNHLAKQKWTTGKELSEREYVRSLYELRNHLSEEAECEILNKLSDEKSPVAEEVLF